MAVVTTNGEIMTNYKRRKITAVSDELLSKGYFDPAPFDGCFEGLANEVENLSEFSFRVLETPGAPKMQDVAISNDGTVLGLGVD